VHCYALRSTYQPGASDGANAYHWNGNLKLRPFDTPRFEPYVTGGLGSFTVETVVNDRLIGTTPLR
jgi:hypothetical protein